MPHRRRRSRPQRPIHIDLIWESTPPDPRCAVCSTPITVSPHGRPLRPLGRTRATSRSEERRAATGRPRVYCSNACRQKHYRHHKRRFTDNVRHTDRLALRADRLLRSSERYRGRVDDVTPIFPNRLITRRDTVLLDLRNGFPLVHCQWCGIPMTRLAWHGPRKRCCSKVCQAKFTDFLKRLHDALMRERIRLDPVVGLRLRLFNAITREPQGVLRFEINVCDHCRKPYPVYGLTSRFCSKRCRQAAWRRARRVCRYCSRRFKVNPRNRWHHVYCSKACRSRYVRRAARQALIERACQACGKTFTPERHNAWKQVCCSRRCRSRIDGRKFRARRRAPNKKPLSKFGEGLG